VPQRVLSRRALNRALLARQRLLERSDEDLVTVVEQVGGLQTQYAPSAYIGLWSRLRSFRRNDLTRALEERQVVQGTLMRSTIHIVSARDYPLLAAGLRRGRREWWVRIQGRQLDGIDLDAAAGRLRHHLADGPLRQATLIERMTADGYPRAAVLGAGVAVDLVRVPPSGTWDSRRADLYGLAATWLPATDATEADGMDLLARRYLGGFGPATVADLAGWAGLPVTHLRPAIDRLELRRYRDQDGRELLDLPGAPLPDPDTPAPVRYLPTWDATLLVHARRSQILPERHRPRVFATRNPQSFPTFLVDGAVAGTWRYEEGRVSLEPFERLPRGARDELETEGATLATFHAAPAPGDGMMPP
jgi:hypothetical protein